MHVSEWEKEKAGIIGLVEDVPKLDSPQRKGETQPDWYPKVGIPLLAVCF